MARTAIVTGGVTGIGAATCQALQKAGYQVAATYFGNEASATKFHEETGIPIFQWNVADFDACQHGVTQVVGAIGPIDILVNNAGVTRDATLHKMTYEQWRSVIDVDLSGCFNMCRSVIETMRERRFGRIVNISSVNGLAGQFGQTNYAAAKAGIIGFTKALALEGAARALRSMPLRPDIRTRRWWQQYAGTYWTRSSRRCQSDVWQNRMRSRAALFSLSVTMLHSLRAKHFRSTAASICSKRSANSRSRHE